MTFHGVVQLLELGLLLREHPDTEVSVLVGFESGGQDQVLPGGEAEAAAHLPEVDEGLGPCGRRVAEEEVPVQVNVPLATELERNGKPSITLKNISLLHQGSLEARAWRVEPGG